MLSAAVVTKDNADAVQACFAAHGGRPEPELVSHTGAATDPRTACLEQVAREVGHDLIVWSARKAGDRPSIEIAAPMDGMIRPRTLFGPTEFQTDGEGGLARVQCNLQPDGSLTDCTVLEAVKGQDPVAFVSRWKIRPAMFNGKAIPIRYIFNFRFTPPK